MSTTLHAHAVKYLRKLLNYPLGGLSITPEEAKEGLRLLGTPKTSEKVKTYRRAARAKDAKKIAAHRMSTKDIRMAVRERAGGLCEACRKRWGFWGWTMDHFLGGTGRRRQKQTVENCWALCGTGTVGCHGRRTFNEPDAAHWNAKFREHCERHGYPVLSHIEHKALPRRGTA